MIGARYAVPAGAMAEASRPLGKAPTGRRGGKGDEEGTSTIERGDEEVAVGIWGLSEVRLTIWVGCVKYGDSEI